MSKLIFVTLITAIALPVRIKSLIINVFLNGTNSFLNPAKPKCYLIIQKGFVKRDINRCQIQKQFYAFFTDRL